MILVKVIVFAVLKILHSLVSMQESFHASNCWSNQNYERFPIWPNLYLFFFNFQKHLTVKTHLVLKIKNAASFVKISFYGTRGCIKMRKDLETFHANKGYQLAIAVFITILSFSKKKLVVHFSNVICAKTRPCRLLLLIWKWINSTLSFIWLEISENIFSPWVSFSWVRFCFLESGSKIGFKAMLNHYTNHAFHQGNQDQLVRNTLLDYR